MKRGGLFIAMLVLGTTSFCRGQTVHFADANLKEAVKQTLGITYDPGQREMLALQGLSAEDAGITDLTGLEYAANLTFLSIWGNGIDSIWPLRHLVQLKHLDVSDNRITDINDLELLANLENLQVTSNQISNISVLERMTELTVLQLDKNPIGDVSALSGLVKLTYLDLESSSISDINDLSNLTNLIVLDISNQDMQGSNKITDLQPISGMTKLEDLAISNNHVGDISVVANMDHLRVFDAMDCAISDIEPLTGLMRLNEHLELRLNPLPAIAYTRHLPKIQENNRGLVYDINLFYDPWSGQYTLTITSTEGGIVTEPGEGQFEYSPGVVVSIRAMADRVHRFAGWTGSAVDTGKVVDPSAAQITVMVDGDYTLLANFALPNGPSEVHFPDPNLEDAIKQALGIPDTRVVTEDDMEALYGLDAEGRGIADLTGLKHAIRLEWIDLARNDISDVSPLQHLDELTSINLTDNSITDISPLFGLPLLEHLHAHENHISNVEGIAALSNLKTLGLWRNDLSNLLPLGGMIQLERLYLGANHIADISALEGMTHLTLLKLDGGDNDVSDIRVLEDMNDLEELNLWDNSISDISALAGKTKLEFLDLGGNQISDISPLKDSRGLRILHLGGNQIGDISVLKDMNDLEELRLWNTGISDISPLDGKAGLRFLQLAGNEISDISFLEDARELTALYLGGNPIGSIAALEDVNDLEELDLWNTGISDISPLEGKTKLRVLGLDGNQISDISALEDMAELVFLDLGGNQISNISALAGKTELEELHLWGNQISDLRPLAGMTKLWYLNLASNRLYDNPRLPLMDVLKRMASMTHLYLAYNQISDISGLAYMSNLTEAELQWNLIDDISPLAELTNLSRLDLTANPLSADAYETYIPQVIANNPGIELLYGEPASDRILVVSSTAGGSVIVPGEGRFHYDDGEVVPIEAMLDDAVYLFAGWTGSAVNNGKVTDPSAPQTTVTVDGDYSVVANFRRSGEPWEVVYTDDCEGQVGPEWSHADRDVTPIGERWFLGQFGSDVVTLTLQDLPSHSGVRLSFDLFVIRTWDGDDTASPPDEAWGPDIWSVGVRGEPPLLRTTFDNHYTWNSPRQSYPGEYPNPIHRPQTGAVESNTLGYGTLLFDIIDSVYHFDFIFHHTSDSIMVDFSASLIVVANVADPRDNESWGVDNVRVEISGEYLEPTVPLIAWSPQPVDKAFGVISPVLRWNAGRTAAYHDVYFGDRANLTGRNLRGRQTETEYSPPGGLAPGVTYYWRVDEVESGGTTVHTGDVWSFTAGEPGPINEPQMGESLGEIFLDTPESFDEQVETNNVEGPNHPEYNRTHVELVEGLEPDPNGMMRMQNLPDLDPNSPAYGEIVEARAKGSFEPCQKASVLVRFSYLFERSVPGLELVAYFSDVPELLDRDDPSWDQHYVEIGSVPEPPAGRPGALGSGRFGVFEQWVSTGGLDLGNGMWVELQLVEDAVLVNPMSAPGALRLASADSGGSALVDDWAVEVYCDGICMDLNWSDTADEEDFLLVIASCGSSATMLEGGVGSRYCLDGAFSSDGYVDTYDVQAWDWALGDSQRVIGNFCRVPLPLIGGSEDELRPLSASTAATRHALHLANISSLPGELLVLGKRRASTAATELLHDCFCVFDRDHHFTAEYAPADLPSRCSIRIVRGPADGLYLVHSERGVLRIDEGIEEVIPPGKVVQSSDPRYGKTGFVDVGIQGEGSECYGRPILDVAFDTVGYAYVVPVVVRPLGRDAYVGAAQLQLQPGANPPYEIVQFFDDPPPANDNQERNHLREIEVDAAGNVYLANAHRLNESCILWKYDAAGTVLQRLDLLSPDSQSQIADPLALHISADGATLYLTSGQRHRKNREDCVIYGLSTEDFAPARSIAIENMQQATSITEDPATGALWVVGFSMPNVPAWPSSTDEPFYVPYLAEVPPDAESTTAAPIASPAQHNLALPTSILWTGE